MLRNDSITVRNNKRDAKSISLFKYKTFLDCKHYLVKLLCIHSANFRYSVNASKQNEFKLFIMQTTHCLIQFEHMTSYCLLFKSDFMITRSRLYYFIFHKGNIFFMCNDISRNISYNIITKSLGNITREGRLPQHFM